MVGKALRAVLAGDLATEHCSDRAVDISYRFADLHWRSVQDGFLRLRNQQEVQRFVQSMILCDQASASEPRSHWGFMNQRGKFEVPRFPMVDVAPLLEHVDSADHLIHRSESELGHPFPDFLREIEKEIDDILRRSCEFCAKQRILACNAYRTRVQ